MTRFNSGLVGTERTVSPVTASGVWTVNEQTLLNRASLWPLPEEQVDPYIGYVSLLLKMNGANGSTVFTDSSLYNNTVTANGNAQISTAQSKFDGASAYFDGSGDFLSFPNNSLFAFGEAPFTIEMWIYQAGTPSGSAVISEQYTGPGDAVAFSIGFCSGTAGSTTGSRPFFGLYNGSSWTGAVSATSLNNNQWYHIAGVRSGNTLTLYIDGVSVATTTTTYSIGVDEQIFIGKRWDASGTPSDFNGYIDELRISKGIARYTSTFQPRTTPFPTTTSNTGDLYYPSVSLLLHMDGSNGSTTFADNSSNAFVPTVNGNASISTTDSMFGGASGIFDGTGDYISFADNAAFELGSDDFTIEFWMKTVQERQSATIIARDDSSFGSGSWVLMFNRASSTSGEISVFTGAFSNSVALLTTSGVNIRDGQWHHVAWVRSGTNHYLFVDGIQRASRLSTSLTISDMTVRLYIGADFYLTGRDYNGSLDELRFTKGIARYVSAFTPPSVPFSNSL